jgi:CheY-like chemotaxis protein
MENTPIFTFLIDDDADDREIFELTLASLSLPTRHCSASSASEALTFFSTQPHQVPHVIFMDLNMPRMGGRECYRELRKLPPLKEVPICIYSTDITFAGQLPEDDGEHILFLEKPSDLHVLAEKLEDILLTTLEPR